MLILKNTNYFKLNTRLNILAEVLFSFDYELEF